MATKQTIEFTAKNAKAFTGWLKRFASIDNSLLMEIDEKTSQFIGKTYNEERSVVKMSSIKFEDAGLTTKVDKKDAKRIKVGIYNIPRLIKVIDQFNDMEFSLAIDYQEVIGEAEPQFAGEKLFFKNKSLKMTVECTSLNIFKYIPDQLFLTQIAKIDSLGTFELSKSNIDKINSLCTLDNDHDRMEFKFKDNEIFASGKSFEFLIGEIGSKSASINIFKNQYDKVDVENYSVELGEDRIVFKSKDSDTLCVISMTNEKD